MRVQPIWRPSEVGSSSCQVGEAGAVAVATGGREAEMSRQSTATGKQRRGSGRIQSWSCSGAMNNGGGESAPIRFTWSSSRQLRQHGVRGTRPSAQRQMDIVSGIREEGGCEFGAVVGAMEEGLRFHGSGEGSFRGEGDLAPTRYEWGIRRGNHVLRTHLSEMWGRVTVLPLPLGFLAWVCVLRVGDSRVTLLLPNSGRERFRARRACFEI